MRMGIFLQKDLVTGAQEPSEEGWQRPRAGPALPTKEAACSLSRQKASFQLASMLTCLPYPPVLFGSSECAQCGFGNSFTGSPPPQVNPTWRHPGLALQAQGGSSVPPAWVWRFSPSLKHPPEKQSRRLGWFCRLFCPWGTRLIILRLLFSHPTLPPARAIRGSLSCHTLHT